MVNKQISLNEIYQKLVKIEAALKRLEKVDSYIEDLEFARRTEEAWAEIDAGKYTRYDSAEDFLTTLKGKDAKNN